MQQLSGDVVDARECATPVSQSLDRVSLTIKQRVMSILEPEDSYPGGVFQGVRFGTSMLGTHRPGVLFTDGGM